MSLSIKLNTCLRTTFSQHLSPRRSFTSLQRKAVQLHWRPNSFGAQPCRKLSSLPVEREDQIDTYAVMQTLIQAGFTVPQAKILTRYMCEKVHQTYFLALIFGSHKAFAHHLQQEQSTSKDLVTQVAIR